MPGAGKSVLCSITIDHIETQLCRPTSNRSIVFAYCRYSDQHTARDIFASLVKQLLERHPSVLRLLEDIYAKHKREKTLLSKEELVELLQKLVTQFDRVFIALDALDEVSGDTKVELLRGFASFPHQASLLLFSRTLDSFTYLLPRKLLVSITERNQADIDIFINGKILETPRFADLLRGKETLKHEVFEQIKIRSKGMFLVASLQVESLKRCTTVKKLRIALNALPVGVHAMYQATWARINAQSLDESHLAKRAILWVAYAVRSLHMEELQQALAICGDGDLEDGEFDEEDTPPENLLLAVCCGLLSVGEGDKRVVRLVHYTALDFVRTLTEDSFDNPHTFLGTSCIIFLRHFNFPNAAKGITIPHALSRVLHSEPLLDYAYGSWGLHAHEASSQGRGLPLLVREFFFELVHYPWRKSKKAGRFDILFPVHVVAYYGLQELFEECIIVHGASVDAKSGITRSTPLMFAAQRGHKGLVQRLREDPEVDLNAQNWWGESALILASEKGQDEIVSILLYPSSSPSSIATPATPKVVIDVHAETYQEHATALILAANAGRESIVKMLLQYDPTINIDAEDSGGNTALLKACQSGNIGLARALLCSPDIDIDVNRKNIDEATPLYYAVFNNYLDILKLLLDHGRVDVNERFVHEEGTTAILHGCSTGNEALVRMLLDYNMKAKEHGGMMVDVGAQMRRGQSGLLQAAWKGHTNVASLLLQYTGDGSVKVNARDDEGNAALLVASGAGHEDYVKLLLSLAGEGKESVDIHAANRAGVTPILAAKARGHDTIVASSCLWCK